MTASKLIAVRYSDRPGDIDLLSPDVIALAKRLQAADATNLELTPSLLPDAQGAQIAAAWLHPEATGQEIYQVDVATDSGFTQLVGAWSTGQGQTSAVLEPLLVATTYYVRVQAGGWSASASTTTPNSAA